MAAPIVPYGKIRSATDLGALVRKKRKENGILQSQAAGLAGVGARFLSELENGKPTAELEKALQVLQRLGLEIWIVPRGSAAPRPRP